MCSISSFNSKFLGLDIVMRQVKFLFGSNMSSCLIYADVETYTCTQTCSHAHNCVGAYARAHTHTTRMKHPDMSSCLIYVDLVTLLYLTLVIFAQNNDFLQFKVLCIHIVIKFCSMPNSINGRHCYWELKFHLAVQK